MEALGWTLVHFLWQGAALAAVLWLVMRGLGKAAAVWRYAAAVTAMGGMLMAVGATLWWHWPAGHGTTAAVAVRDDVSTEVGERASRSEEPRMAGLIGGESGVAAAPRSDERPAMPEVVPARRVATAELVAERLRPWLPWIVGSWAVGVAVVLGRLGRGWWWVRRLRRAAVAVPEGRWGGRFSEIAHSLQVSRPVRLLSSATARVPLVIGWLKPVVIVPAALLAGLPAAQLEAILAHELAHIRRNDYVVNWLQCLVEALLFYHPAVWWVSGQVRAEREHCCDDVAARLCGGALPYAKALTALEEWRGEEPILGLAASGGPLLQRIRRLLGVRETTTVGWPPVVTLFALALLPLAMVLGGASPSFVAPQAHHLGDDGWSSAGVAQATASAGEWEFPGGATLRLYGELFHATDVMTTALISWPEQDGRLPVQWHTSIASDAFANREKWAVAWEKEKPVLWVASRSLGSAEKSPDGRPVANRLKRIDFSDPAHIREDYFQGGWPEIDGPSASVVDQLAAHVEVRQGGHLSSTLHSWASAGASEKIDLSAVQNIHLTMQQDGGIVIDILELQRTCRPEALADTLTALRAEWTAKRGASLAGKAMVPRVTVSAPPETAPDAIERVRSACVAADCGPFAAGAIRATGGIRRFESGGYHGLVLEPAGKAPIFIVAPKAFSLVPEADARSGLLTFPVATTAKELRIRYGWDPARPGQLTLRNHDFEEQIYDLSRGGIIWVTFDHHEFNAALYTVPGEAGTGTDEASLAAVIARARAWWETADEKTRWEQCRVLVPDSGYYAGQPLDASVDAVVWGEPNEVGLRLGLGGLTPGASVPTGQALPLKQFIRNDGPKPIRLSATGPFNEGIEGSLVRADGARIPHIANYRWPMVAIRARLEPGHFIELQSRPLQTVYANPDGSASGALLGYDSGFIVKPGDYVLELVHHIGRFLGAPANTFTGNPSIAPGLGEWTGTLRAATLPVRLTDPVIGTAKPGDVREDRRLDRIQFKPDRLLLSHPAPGMTGSHSFVVGADGNWPTFAGGWLIAQPELGYLAAWDEGNRRLWYVNGTTVQKLDLAEGALRDAGSWPVTTPADGYGDMPPGVRTALGLPRAENPSVTPEGPTPPGSPMVKIRSTQLALGPPREDGLRVAWVFSPRRDEYRIGEIVKCAVWFYNDGPAAITFTTDAWHQFDTWKATRADGSPIEVRTTWFTGLTPQETITLQPGETREIPAHGVGIGNAEFAEHYGRAELGAELWADPGDEVTCVWEVAVSPSSTERLTTGPVTFRVTPAPPEGPRPPIVTDRLGSYNLGHGAILNLSQIGSAQGYTNYAWITWEKGRGASADGKADIAMPRSADPKDYSLPTFVLSRTVPALWIVEHDRIRKIDFSTLGETKESVWPHADVPADFGGAPEDVREAVRKVAPQSDEQNGSASGSTPPIAASDSANADVLDTDGAIRLASEAVLKFLRTEELDVRFSLLDLSEGGREELKQFFERHPLPAEPNAVPGGFTELDKGLMMANRQPDGSWLAKILVYLPVSARTNSFMVNIRSGVARIDWHLSTVHQAGVHEDLWAGTSGEAAVLYATVRRGDYFNYGFDDERYSCYELTSFLVDRRFFGYAEKGSTLEKTLDGLIDHGFSRVRVVIPTGPRDQRQLLVRDAAPGHRAEAGPSKPNAEREGTPDASTAPASGFTIRLVSDAAGPTTERLPEKTAAGEEARFLDVEKQIIIASSDLTSAAVEAPETGDSRWSIRVELTPEAGRRFEAFTGQHVGRRLAIVVDGVVLMAPTVRTRIGRSITISGNFTEAEVKRLVEAIKPSSEAGPVTKPHSETPEPDAPKAATPAHRLRVLESQGLGPVRQFRVLAGVPSGVSSEFEKSHGVEVITWQPHTLREGKDGELLWPLDRSYEMMALRVEADGFMPQVITGLEKANGARELTFQLVDDAGVRGRVMTPENRRPAHDATVVLAMIGRGARLQGTTFPELPVREAPATPREAWERPLVVTPDGNGAFTLPTEIDPTAVVLILHGDGVLALPYAAWKAQPDVTLQPWGRIHGRVKWGDSAGGGEKVALSANHGDLYGYPDILSQSDEMIANDDGVFVFQRVLPGSCQLSCPITPDPGNAAGFTAINLTGRLTHTTVVPGPAITPVVIGGVGRTVAGRLSGRASYDDVTLRLHPTAPHIGFPGDEEIWKAWSAFQASPQGRHFFRDGLKVAADGTFQIPAVLPGSYQLFFEAPGADDSVASSSFIVPPEHRDHPPEPMDLGEIKARR